MSVFFSFILKKNIYIYIYILKELYTRFVKPGDSLILFEQENEAALVDREAIGLHVAADRGPISKPALGW